MSHSPAKRLIMLQTANSDRLELRGVMPGGPIEEINLHRQFAELRIRGEWFDGTPDLMIAISKLIGRPGRTVEAECLRRDGDRRGLRGVMVHLIDRKEDREARGLIYGRGGRQVIFYRDDAQFPPWEIWQPTPSTMLPAETIASQPLTWRGTDLAEWPPYWFEVPADRCRLVGHWPIAC